MPSDVLITPASSKIDFTDGSNATKRLNISGTAFSFNSNLNVLSSTSLSSAFKAEGVNGTLFEVVDDLSNSLMSVNTIGGLPVFEVFANNSIIAGQYNANDFVLIGNKIGIGTASPTGKLTIFQGNNPGITLFSNNAAQYAYLQIGRTSSELEIGVVSGSNQFFIGTVTGDAVIKQNSTGKLHLGYASAAPSITIDSSNNVGIGNTGANNKLHVAGSASIGSSYNVAAPTNGLVVQGNVGIGTTTVSSTLHLYSLTGPELRLSAGSTGSGGLRFLKGDSGESYINNQDSYAMRFQIAGSTKMSIIADGNVGIGITNPSSLLNVSGTGTLGSVFQEKITNGTTTLALGSNATAAEVQSQGSVPLYLNYGGNNVCIVPVGSGNVGIGTNSPSQLLHISSITTAKLKITADTDNLDENDIGGIEISQDGGITASYFGFDNANHLVLGVNSTTGPNIYLGTRTDGTSFVSSADAKVTILNGGSVGIGTTNPTNKLHVYSNDNELVFIRGTTAGAWMNIQSSTSNLWSIGADGVNGFSVYNRNSNSYALIVRNDGNLGIGNITTASNKLHVNGSASIGSNYNTTAPTNGLIVEGSVAIGATTASDKLTVVNGNISLSDSYKLYNGSASDSVGLFFSAALQVNISGYNGIIFRSSTTNIAGQTERMRIANNGNVGIGITVPSATLHLNSTTSGATLLRADGTNGTLFSVVDDLSDSLMSVNNSAGLPVLEVFADDRVVAGQYGANDFVLRNNKLGLGTNNPAYRLNVYDISSGSVDEVFVGTIGSDQVVGGRTGGSFGISTKSTSNGNLILTANSAMYLRTGGSNDRVFIKSDGNVGIGTVSPLGKVHIYGFLRVGGAANEQTGTIALGNDANPVGTYGDNGIFRGGIGSIGSGNYTNISSYQGIVFNVQAAGFGSQATRMLIDINGNVGIGATNPATLLQIGTGTPTSVTGGIQFGDDTGTRLYRSAPGIVTCSGTIAATFSGNLTGNVTGNATNVTGTVAIANGGSGQTSAQAAMNAFAGAVTSGSYLRGNGTNVVMSAIQAADVPALNQNTTGNAATATTSDRLTTADNRTISPSEDSASRLRFGFTSWANNDSSPYADYLHLRSYSDSSGGNDNLVMFRKDAIGMRIYQAGFGTSVAYSSFKDVAFTDQSFFIGTTSVAINRASAALTLNGVNISGTAASETLGTVTGRGASTSTQISVGTTAGGSMYTGIKSGAGYSDAVSGATFKSITDHPTGGSFAFAAYYNGAPGTGTNSFYVAANGGAYFAQGVGIGVTPPLQALHINGNIILDGTTNGYTQSATRGIGYGSNNGAVSVDGFSGMDIQSVNAPAPNNGNYSQNLRFWTHHYGTGTGAAPRMFLQYNGNLGIGTVSPTAKLNVLSTSSLSSVLKTEGVNGTLFEVTDDLSNSLMSVNTIGGLPVFEVFANNSVIAGQYGQNDFVISGNKIGLGYANPVNKLTVSGSVSIGSSYNVAAPSNGLIVQGSVGIGITNPTAKLDVAGGGLSVSGWSNNNSGSTGGVEIGWDGTQGIFQVYDRVNNNYEPILINGSAIQFFISGGLKWTLTTAGVLQSNNAQTIQTSTGNLTLATAAGNGHVLLSPHGTGNVGIGTASPGASLEIYATPATSTTLRQMLIINTDFGSASGTGFGGSIVFRGRTAGNLLRDNAQITAYNEDIGDNGYALGFFTRPNDTLGMVQRMTIARGGNVGIGTVSPSQILDVRGNIKLGADNSGNYIYYVTDIERTIIRTARSDVSQVGLFRSDGWGNFTVDKSIGIGYSLGSSFASSTIGNGNLYVAGNVGIGTTAPAALLQIGTGTPTAVTGGIQFGGDTSARLYRSSSGVVSVSNSFAAASGYVYASNYLQTGNNLIYPASFSATQTLQVGNTAQNAWITGISIAPGGNVVVAGTLTESSSIRYKENIQTIIAPILPKLNEIRPVTYNKKDNPNNIEYGIIAEELNDLFPELVNKNNNGEVESVNYSRLTVLLIKAVKELKQEIEILKNK